MVPKGKKKEEDNVIPERKSTEKVFMQRRKSFWVSSNHCELKDVLKLESNLLSGTVSARKQDRSFRFFLSPYPPEEVEVVCFAGTDTKVQLVGVVSLVFNYFRPASVSHNPLEIIGTEKKDTLITSV